MRLIDADELLMAFPVDGEAKQLKAYVRMTIHRMPTVDAVQVVRCNDCNEYQDVHQWCKLHAVEMKPMDFCSYGERKNGGQR